jgi:hypothetical protein
LMSIPKGLSMHEKASLYPSMDSAKAPPSISWMKILNVVLARVNFLRLRIQTSYNIDCVLGSLCYIRPCSIWIAWQRSSLMKGELRWRGPSSISKFHHHNINGGAVDDTWRHR